MEEMDSSLSPSSPLKRRRKVPEKFRDHVIQELTSQQDPTWQEVPALVPEPWAEPEACLERDAARDENREDLLSGATMAPQDPPAKRRRGRPPKQRPGDLSGDLEALQGTQGIQVPGLSVCGS